MYIRKSIIIIRSIVLVIIAIIFCIYKIIEVNKLNKTFTYRLSNADDAGFYCRDIDLEISKKTY